MLYHAARIIRSNLDLFNKRAIQYTQKLTTKRNAVWCLSNLCRGKTPSVDLVKIEQALPVLSKLIQTESDVDCLVDACWAVRYFMAS